MKGLVLIGATTVGAVVITVGTLTFLHEPTRSGPAIPSQTPDASATPQAPSGDSSEVLTAHQKELLLNPETLTFARRLDFQKGVQQFFRQADNLPHAERDQRAEALKAQLSEYEATDQVSAAEGLMVRIALAKLANQEAEAQSKAIQGLIADYQADSRVRREAWLAKPRPEFDAYKKQEKQILREVMAMEEIPQGMDRGEYLRERLLEARIAAQNSGDAR